RATGGARRRSSQRRPLGRSRRRVRRGGRARLPRAPFGPVAQLPLSRLPPPGSVGVRAPPLVLVPPQGGGVAARRGGRPPHGRARFPRLYPRSNAPQDVRAQRPRRRLAPARRRTRIR